MNVPEIFVVWHPACALGDVLAPRIHAWLRPGNGLGPHVYYRSPPAPDAPRNGLPVPIPGERRCKPGSLERTGRTKISNLQIVLALVDENLVADPSWRYWLTSLKTEVADSKRVILPVALDATAYNLPPELRELNFLRPAGLPLAGTAGISLEDTTAALRACVKIRSGDPLSEAEQKACTAIQPALELVTRSLLKQLTETLTRLLLPNRPNPAIDESDAPPKVSIFLSHAKADGRAPAQRLRDYIYSQTQMAAFYDENDIAFGSIFAKVIDSSLGAPGTAALIAVRSAQYARRPWCRREISLFRKPQREDADPQTPLPPNGYERWRLYPLLVVEAMDGAQDSFGIPEFGNAPLIHWGGATAGIEEKIVTTVMRDAMLATYHSAVAASIPKEAHRVVLNWLPDPTTLLQLESARSPHPLDVVHPGQGFSGAELDILNDFFPNLTFHSFEEIIP